MVNPTQGLLSDLESTGLMLDNTAGALGHNLKLCEQVFTRILRAHLGALELLFGTASPPFPIGNNFDSVCVTHSSRLATS